MKTRVLRVGINFGWVGQVVTGNNRIIWESEVFPFKVAAKAKADNYIVNCVQ